MLFNTPRTLIPLRPNLGVLHVSLEVVENVTPKDGEIEDDVLREKLSKINLLIAKIEAMNSNPPPSSDFVTKSSSTSLNLFLEETNTFDNSLTESKTFCFDLEENSSGSTTTLSDYSLPDYEAFYLDDDHIEEKSSGSTTTHADFSQYDSFIFDLSINPFPPADRSDFYHEEFAGELLDRQVTHMLQQDSTCLGISTYEEYELNKIMTRDLEEPWLDNGDHKWYDKLADGKLKEETLMHKAKVEESWGDATPGVMKLCAWLKSSVEKFHELDYNILVKLEECCNYGADNVGYTKDNQEHKKEHHDLSTCRVRRFEMIKYLFDVEDEYIAIKEHECSDHLKTNIDTCQAYRELFRIMDEGWLVTKA
ncbi:hypothetical protein Tco_0801006 [Tanacetum coccineum]|uniref:Uncharacterized protein n=1 Tax=Tanacetum coccineum TaxID=301880 RepID=A0ABQ4ZYZ1_9ASTR